MSLNKSERKKVLMLSDSIRGFTGVGRMANEIVVNTIEQFNWIHISPENITDPQLRKLDMSIPVAELTGVADASLDIIPFHSFGDIELLRLIIHNEHIDAIVIFQDPRYWTWLFEHEREIRQYVPIIFYNIWDNLPVPHYNKPWYESVDSLVAISTLTEKVNKAVMEHSTFKPLLSRVPHGINENGFHPIQEVSAPADYIQYIHFKDKMVQDAEFVVLYNSRNMDRKNPMGVIEAFDKFISKVPDSERSGIKLLMHTNPLDPAGTNLIQYIKDNAKHKDNIVFSAEILDDVHINYLYNIASVTISLSYNEGWGLSLTESVMAGTPIIATYTGGMMDQLPTPSNWAYSVYPAVQTLLGNMETPYIYCDRVNTNDVAKILLEVYTERANLEEWGYLGREWMIEQGFTTKIMAERIAVEINKAIDQFEPRANYEIVKI